MYVLVDALPTLQPTIAQPLLWFVEANQRRQGDVVRYHPIKNRSTSRALKFCCCLRDSWW